jgi:phage baseplate assembly protein W
MASTIYSKPVVTSVNNINTPSMMMYRGFSTVSSNTQNYSLYDLELIKQDLLNHFYVRKGERLMNPRFGTIIWDLLFEPLTEQIKNLIIQNVNEILNFDPRISAGNIIVTQYDTGLQIECSLKYLSYNLTENLKIQFDQNNNLMIS